MLMGEVDFAGSPQFFPQTCSGDCYLDYVINNGTSQYANAYFDVGYVRVFTGNSSGTGVNTGSGSTGGSNSTSMGYRARVEWLLVVVAVGVVVGVM